MAKYALGPVKPHLQKIADHVGTLFKVKVIGGWRPWSSTDRWEHPKGRAADFMTDNKEHGDRIAQHLVDNADAYNVLYVIWWRRIWRPGRGWEVYKTGATSNNPNVAHTNHVHLSVTEDQNISLMGDTGGSGITQLGNPLDDILGRFPVLKELEEIAKYLNNPLVWRRAGIGALGILLVLVALGFIRRIKQ